MKREGTCILDAREQEDLMHALTVAIERAKKVTENLTGGGYPTETFLRQKKVFTALRNKIKNL